ncbi:MAG: hypothetical protein U5K29_04025 [Acidimicrobiales bacterium]|nr:hypothetical protein [Acidimicrobiales bacterium]
MEALFHQGVTLTLLGQHLVELCPDLGGDDQILEAYLREGRRHEFGNFTAGLGNRGYYRATGLPPRPVNEVLQVARESMVTLSRRFGSDLKGDRVEALVIARRVALDECFDVISGRSHGSLLNSTVRSPGQRRTLPGVSFDAPPVTVGHGPAHSTLAGGWGQERSLPVSSSYRRNGRRLKQSGP